MIRVLAVVVALACLGACDRNSPAAQPTETTGATADCGPVEQIPIQGEGHLVGDQDPPVPYNSTPPTSGWHTAFDIPITIRPDSDPMTEPEQVTVLELGGIVVAHNGLESQERDSLAAMLREQYPGQAALTLYDQLGEGEVAMTAWGVLQRCSALDLEAVEAFIEAHAQR